MKTGLDTMAGQPALYHYPRSRRRRWAKRYRYLLIGAAALALQAAAILGAMYQRGWQPW